MVSQVDFTASQAMDDMVADTLSSGRRVLRVGCGVQVFSMLKKQGVFGRFDKDQSDCIQDKRLDGLKVALKFIRQGHK